MSQAYGGQSAASPYMQSPSFYSSHQAQTASPYGMLSSSYTSVACKLNSFRKISLSASTQAAMKTNFSQPGIPVRKTQQVNYSLSLFESSIRITNYTIVDTTLYGEVF